MKQRNLTYTDAVAALTVQVAMLAYAIAVWRRMWRLP